jgi:hypothetical protein
MNNSKFWGSPNTNLPTNAKPDPMANKFPNLKSMPTKTFHVSKKLGTTGAILLGILVALMVPVYIFIARPASILISAAKNLKDDKNAIVKAVSERDLVALDKALTVTENNLKDLQSRKNSSFGWAKNLKIFKLNEFYADSESFINAGLYALQAMREMEKVVLPFADAAGLKVKEDQQVTQQTGLMEAFQSWVSLMPQVAGQMDGVIAAVSKIGDEMAGIDTTKYPVKIKGFQVRANIEFLKNNLSKSDDYAPDVKQALTIFPRVLGVGTATKRYMIIMQNDKELRPTGGFMTNYATFKIQNALLQSDFTSKDMYSIDLALETLDRLGYDFPDAPAPYMKYLKVEKWFTRDMNYSPDFPSSMDQFLKFYTMAGRYSYEIKPVDGIIAIDTDVVKELLAVTGPVTLNGVTYNSDNVVLELERIASLVLREQTNRKGVLGNLMQQMLINVFESDKNLWSTLIDKGVALALQKHIQVYLFDTEAQSLVEKYGFAGRIKDPVKGDYSMVVSTNLGGDKTNWFVTKDVNQKIEKSGEKWLRTVSITYTYPQPSQDYAPFIVGFKDWVRVYAPLGSEFISVDGTEDGTSTDSERGKTWFSGYLELTPGNTKTLVFKYYLPANIITNGMWDVTLQKQAGITEENYKFVSPSQTKELKLSQDTQVSVKL